MSAKISQEDKSSYRSIFKATSLFGGVQAYQILVGIVKSKMIAVLLGPLGVGVLGLYTSAEQLLKATTEMGLSSSAVRDLSEANNCGNVSIIARKTAILKRLIWLTGLLGMLAGLILSPVLSKVSFGNFDYTIPFAFFSITLLLDQLCNGQKIILQGLRRLKSLALTSAIGSTMGLVVSIPIYYWFGVSGIVPTLILTSCTTLFFTWIVARKIKFPKVQISNKSAISEGSTMLKLGIAMSVSGILGTLSSYVIRSFIRYYGSIDEVGLFTAGFMLMTTYTGLVFTAMSTDYFPRLAEVNHDNEKCKEIINQQSEIGILILTPILMVCMVFVPFIVTLLYSDKFLLANGYILWASTGMLFKMASWAISYVYVAKAEAKMFAIIETIGNVIYVITSIIGYVFYGMSGIGIAFATNYLIYLIIVYSFAARKYDFSFSATFCMLFSVESVLLLLCLMSVLMMSGVIYYTVGIMLIVLSSLYSIIELNRRTDLIKLLKSLHGNKK